MIKICSYSHIGFNVKNMEKMLEFYCSKLGMREKFTLTTDDILDFSRYEESQGTVPSPHSKVYIESAKAHPGRPLITYVEMAANQFLEFFYCYEDLKDCPEMSRYYGYQHLAIQVENLEDTWETIIKNGIVPDSPINMGPDFTKQFWVHDPEGNRIEFMEYTSRSFQVLGHRRDGAQDFC